MVLKIGERPTEPQSNDAVLESVKDALSPVSVADSALIDTGHMGE